MYTGSASSLKLTLTYLMCATQILKQTEQLSCKKCKGKTRMPTL